MRAQGADIGEKIGADAGEKAGLEAGEKAGADEAERLGGDEGERIGREIGAELLWKQQQRQPEKRSWLCPQRDKSSSQPHGNPLPSFQ